MIHVDQKLPLGLLSIAAYLESRGWPTDILDFHATPFSPGSLISYLDERRPEFIGINGTTANRKSSYDIARIVKSVIPTCTTFMGGPHASAAPWDVFDSCPEVDCIIPGEGEVGTARLIAADIPLSAGPPPGVVTKQHLSQTSKSERRVMDEAVTVNRIPELSSLPLPAYGKIDADLYFSQIKTGYIACSRGCKYNCSFCSSREVFGRGVRYSKPDRVVREMEALRSRYGVSDYYFYDDNLLTWPDLERFCNIRGDWTWTAQSTVRDLSLDIVPFLKKSGCTRISFGIESGSPRIQRRVGKIVNTNEALQKIEALKSAGIAARAYFIVGFPDETKEEYLQTLDLIRALGHSGLDDIAVFPARPYPGTRLFDQCVQLLGVERSALLDFDYVDDSAAVDSEYISERLRRYDTVPHQPINRRIINIRGLVAAAYRALIEPESRFEVDEYWRP